MKFILFIVRRILSLRYKVTLDWIKNLKHDWPVLILPNHVALVDPRILISFLWKYLPVSPVASEKYYNKPGIQQIMKAVWTVPIWEMSAWADPEKVKEVFAKVVEAMKSWSNILIYPSWQIYRQGFESIKGKQSAYNIANMMPENTKVIWIRDTWLWGSLWSMAWDNGKTSFFWLYWKSIWYVIANLIFFVPKRKVNIYIEDITEQINTYKKMSLNEFNWFLENFYNKNWEEKINYIKHYFYFNDIANKKEPEIITGSEAELNSVKEYDLSKVDESVKNKIKEKISKIKEIDIKWINDNSKLILDLYFDSLDAAEIKSYVQANFDWASNPPITDLKTVGDLIMMAVWQSENEEELKECEWGESIDRWLLKEKLV
jgi:acyl carrier protein